MDSATVRWQAERIEELEQRLAERRRRQNFRRFGDEVYEGFTGSEGRMLHLLLTRDFVSTEALYAVMHHTKREDADLKIVSVLITKIRKKVRPLGLDIKNQFGEGYYIPREQRPAAQRALIPIQTAAA